MLNKTNAAKAVICLLLTALLCGSLSAQKVITGKVTGPDGKPVFGATVTVKGTVVATTTAADGSYSINMPAGAKVLIFSSVGYELAESSVSSATTVDAVMKLQTTSLNEVVVTGYSAQRKKDITGAVSVVNIAELKQQPVGTGEEALQGRASGLNVISSGQPGAPSDIRIRGITSFGNNSPLIIVDGVRGNLHDINVNDIESLQVLKDAAAAIYGVAGSNGVIIVTTKRGRAGKAKVSYDMYVGQATRGDGFDMANALEEGNAIWLQQRNSGTANPRHAQFGAGQTPVVPDYIQTYDPRKYGQPFGLPADLYGYTLCNCPADSVVDASRYDLNSAQITRSSAGTNWYDEITRNAFLQSHNLSVSAGSEKSYYFFSFGFLDQEGIAKFQYLKRYSVRANTQFTIKDKIRVGENLYVFYKDNPIFNNQSEGSPFTTAYRESALIPVYDIMGNFAGTKSQGLGNARNPYADIYRTKDNRGYNWVTSGNVYAEVDFLKHFTARTNFGGVISNGYGYNFNYVGYENAEGNTGSNSFGENANYSTSWTFTNTLTYSNIWGNHNVKGIVGTEAVKNYFRYVGATRSNYFSENPDFWIMNAGTGSQANSGGAGQSTLWSQFARLEYGYANKYLVNATVRRDGTSIFSEDQRWGVFPSVSVAWRISEENFFKNITFVNDLKLRYSWGVMGSTANVDPTNPYNLYGSRLGKSAYDISGTSTSPYVGFYRSNIGNEETTWEEDIITNFGLDAVILNNKLEFTIEWYKKKVSGLLFTQSGVPADIIIAGDAALPKVNIGDIQNTGLDFNATYHATISGDIKLDVTGIITTYNNKVVDLPGLPYVDGDVIRNNRLQRYQEGEAFGAFFGYEVLGIFQTADEVAKAPTQVDAQPGVFRYRDVNGDNKVDAADRTFIGDPNPDFTYGINLALSYKSFDFSAFFFGSQGNDIFNNTLYFTDFPDFFKGGLRREAAVNSWTPQNPNAKVPILRNTGGFSTDNSGYANSYFISDGSYFRAKQIQIGYTFPNTMVNKFGIDRLRVYVQGTNLFTFTSYEGLDPELSSQPDQGNVGQIPRTFMFGIDQGNYPHTPAYLFGLNLNF